MKVINEEKDPIVAAMLDVVAQVNDSLKAKNGSIDAHADVFDLADTIVFVAVDHEAAKMLVVGAYSRMTKVADFCAGSINRRYDTYLASKIALTLKREIMSLCQLMGITAICSKQLEKSSCKYVEKMLAVGHAADSETKRIPVGKSSAIKQDVAEIKEEVVDICIAKRDLNVIEKCLKKEAAALKTIGLDDTDYCSSIKRGLADIESSAKLHAMNGGRR